LYKAEYKVGVKLYVKRVFILDDAKELLPQYLRFVRGIIDSEDLPLNVSREILQQNRMLTSIRTASVKKILSELKNIAANQPEQYLKFITEFNRPLKEGLYSDFANRETLLELIRFKSTKVEGLTSLADVKSRMKEGQKSIYYITGGAESLLRTSPLLEIYKKKEIEVLILDDDIRRNRLFRRRQVWGDRSQVRQQGIDQRGPEGRSRARQSGDAQASARQAEGHARRPGEGCARLGTAGRQPLLHCLRRGGALSPDAADAARHGAERHSRAQAHARNQSRSRDREKAAGSA
jgi:HSP90 family molecular chaperone